MSRVMREWMENPYEHFDKLDVAEPAVEPASTANR